MRGPSRARMGNYVYEQPCKPDIRSNLDNRASKGKEPVTCPVCGAQAYEVQSRDESKRRRGVMEIQRHRPGGGRVSVRRGDVSCLGGQP